MKAGGTRQNGRGALRFMGQRMRELGFGEMRRVVPNKQGGNYRRSVLGPAAVI